MTSYLDDDQEGLFALDPKSEAVAVFVNAVGTELQGAFAQRKHDCKLTQQDLAKSLGVDRSRIHRCLSGSNNLTLESVAELAWAMGGRPEFKIVLNDLPESGCNHLVMLTTTSPETADWSYRHTPGAGSIIEPVTWSPPGVNHVRVTKAAQAREEKLSNIQSLTCEAF
ncbi:helix-turn-helix domain-containing protein [Rhizobium sp. NXC24]|uniref:helix-turn-helix domain-containing protein n=1 Tax=Rhizobium sp. NXC24 TaxID=2048897 RepID=UPI000CDF53E4|nr:helix-turn-helix domain-containing protein [Rhizobium sp. NXC24]AVA20690.1 hypothetical protein NXC24_CH01023 [Rhizobium sp. NXC24]